MMLLTMGQLIPAYPPQVWYHMTISWFVCLHKIIKRTSRYKCLATSLNNYHHHYTNPHLNMSFTVASAHAWIWYMGYRYPTISQNLGGVNLLQPLYVISTNGAMEKLIFAVTSHPAGCSLAHNGLNSLKHGLAQMAITSSRQEWLKWWSFSPIWGQHRT